MIAWHTPEMQLAWFKDGLAISVATLSAQFVAHQDRCERDKEDLRRLLKEQEDKRQTMHDQNQEKFAKLLRYIWFAAGAVAVVEFLVNAGLLTFAKGHP